MSTISFVNIQSIVLMAAVVVAIFLVFKFLKKAYRIFGLIGIALVIAGVFVVSMVDFSPTEYIPDQIISNTSLSLRIEQTENRSYLMNGDSEATYISYNDDQPKILKTWFPIYLDDLEDHYIVIFSHDMHRKVVYHRFRQTDYERHRDGDRLVVIQKRSGYIFDTIDYDLIGHEIDLTSFQEGTNVVTFSVFLPYEDRISHIRYIHYTDDYSIEDSHQMFENFYTEPMGGDWVGMVGHKHTLGDPSWVVDFILSGNLYYYEDSYGTAYYGDLRKQQKYIQFREFYDFSDEIYAKQGYLKFEHDGLYFVDNQLNVVYLDASVATIVATNISLDHWESAIPSDQA